MARINHYYSNEFCFDEHARSQEQLQEIAKKVRENCTVKEICETPYSDGKIICTIYINENLGLRYWIKDEFGHITEIDEEREY